MMDCVGKLRNLAVFLIAKIRPKWGLMGNVDKLGVLGSRWLVE
mgnify:CR=1 FL=1|jgi:hypothetical protein